MPRQTVLLIDDNPDERDLALRAIKRLGLELNVVCASDGPEALDLLGPASPTQVALQPSVILLDIKMPRMNGLEVLRRIRSSPQMQGLPVVMMTSSDEPQDIERCYLQGANSYTVKPMDFVEYLDQMDEIISYWTRLNRPPLQVVRPAA